MSDYKIRQQSGVEQLSITERRLFDTLDRLREEIDVALPLASPRVYVTRYVNDLDGEARTETVAREVAAAADEALKDGRYGCGHCQADENLGSKWHGEKLSTKLSKADPDEVAPTEFDRERASVSLAWFVAVWLAIMAASTFTGVMLYFAGVKL
jgi:transcription initiation factor TFIIIB Brf1 subunit/transcription initiation factor TFIIB